MNPTPTPEHASPSDRAAAGRVRKLFDVARELESRVLEGTPADEWLAGWFRAHRECGSRDRRFLADTLFSAFRWRGWIGSLETNGPIALLAAHQLQALESDAMTPALAAAAEAPPDRIPALGSATLDEKSRVLAGVLGDPDLSAERLVPDWVPAAMACPPETSPDAFLRSCIESFQSRPPLWLTALNGSSGELAGRLRDEGWMSVAESRIPGAVRVEARLQLQELEKKIGPCFEVQDLASQSVVAICEAQPGQVWWDACAGGGGKTIG
ncbi:MAG: hypothetical protein U1E27_09730, partial [Kiritimatiellia bacterium]|nr:hypothetical protein [Kiritimatiellia bacterium]